MPRGQPTRITTEQARRFLVGHLGLARPLGRGARGVRALLGRLRCIQLDPLDVIGSNADLVALARVDGLRRGDVYRHLLPGHAFEHFAKERCLLPASAFPYYRDCAEQHGWWSHEERLRRVPEAVIEAVRAEVAARGPLGAADLTHHGAVQALDWSGWKGTSSATSMALEVLWTRCELVVAGRSGRGKVYDVPGRALPAFASAASGDFARWALVERVHAAGLLCRAGGPHWAMLTTARTSPLPDQLVAEGLLEDVEIEGSPRRYLAPAGFLDQRAPAFDGRMRLLGPLDPLLWDRKLVAHIFGFEYIWEVYKPAALRRWGWYVCPLLHEDRLVARLEGHLADGELHIDRLWREPRVPLDRVALRDLLHRHAEACGADRGVRLRGRRLR